MIYVAFVEIFCEAEKSLPAKWESVRALMDGCLLWHGLGALIDNLVPSFRNPHSPPIEEMEVGEKYKQKPKLMKMGVMTG